MRIYKLLILIRELNLSVCHGQGSERRGNAPFQVHPSTYHSSSDCGTIIATHEVSVGSKTFNPPVNGIEALILECAERGNIRRSGT
jgi:hypothetical protein